MGTINNYTIKVGAGKYSYLDKAYRDLITREVNNCESLAKRWETYEMVLNEIINLDNGDIFERFKYRVTGGENVNHVLLDIIYDELEPNHTIKSLTHKIEEYADIDWLKNFYL
jgi:hypothetical protein